MNPTKTPKGILFFSLIEIAIGLITIVSVSLSLILNFNTKPLNVLSFVYITSMLSFIIGIGLLRFNRQAYELLIFLAGVVILSKILIFSKIIQLNGALQTLIPSGIKDTISIAYHLILLYYLNLKGIKKLFKTELSI